MSDHEPRLPKVPRVVFTFRVATADDERGLRRALAALEAWTVRLTKAALAVAFLEGGAWGSGGLLLGAWLAGGPARSTVGAVVAGAAALALGHYRRQRVAEIARERPWITVYVGKEERGRGL